MVGHPNPRDFLLAFREKWFAAMSGGSSVPFAALAVWVDNKYAQIIFAAMAFVCLWFAAYRVWRSERLSVMASDAKAAVLAEQLKKKVTFYFEPTSPWLFYSEDVRSWVIQIGITVTNTLRDATAMLSSIQRREDDGSWSRPLNVNHTPPLGWPRLERSFEPMDIVQSGLIVVAHVTLIERDRLQMFTNGQGLPSFRNFASDVPSGDYRLCIVVNATSLDQGALQTMILSWRGDPEKIAVEMVPS